MVALIVTWNRREHVLSVLAALSRQSALAAGTVELHVVVIDNTGTDGTAEALSLAWKPDRVVANDTDRAHEPRFATVAAEPAEAHSPEAIEHAAIDPGRAAFASLTLVRNGHNLGGCGGFNTGFAYTAHAFGGEHAPEFVWLVDDDIDLPEDTLRHLSAAMRSDPTIGLVGSRTVDIRDRETTIETTIYFDRDLGRMCPEPPAGHPRFRSHRTWLASPGGGGGQRVGKGHYSGLLDVDVVSACSLLARWSDVVGTPTKPGVGFWDKRYFIYCDDADWSLRFGKAGKRVVLCLNAVVYHTPWLMKLTPQRLYYAQRNAAWMTRKLYGPRELRRITRLWMRNLLRDACVAMTHRRLSHAGVILKTIDDIIDERWGIDGKTAPPPPAVAKPEELADLARRSGASGRPIGLVVHHAGALPLARSFLERLAVVEGLERQTPPAMLIVSNSVPGFEHAAPDAGTLGGLGFDASTRVVIHGPRWPSKLKKQWALLAARPAAIIVFDNVCPLPIVPTCATVHVDSRSPDAPFVERETWWARSAIAARWARTALKAAVHALGVKPDAG